MPDTTTAPAPPDLTVTHRRVFAIALPMTLAYLSTPLLGLVDTAVIGQLGDAAKLAGIAVGALIFDAIFSTMNFLRSGTTALTAQSYGRKDMMALWLVLLRAGLLALGIGLAIMLIGPLLLSAGLTFIAPSSEVMVETRHYFLIRLYASPATLLNYVLLGWLVGLGQAGRGLLLQTVLNGLNILLNTVFVLGFGWGVAGIAWGTLIGEYVTLALGIMLVLPRFQPHLAKLTRFPTRAVLFDRAAFSGLLAVNRDIMIRSFALLFSFLLFSRLGAQFGPVILAANAVLMNFFALGGYFLDGLATAAEQLAGMMKGARNRAGFQQATRLSVFWGFLLAGCLSLILLVFGKAFIAFLTTSPEVRASAETYLFWAALTPFFGVLAFEMDGIFIGATWVADMRNMMLLSTGIFTLAALGLVHNLGPTGLWIAFDVFLAARGLSLLALYPSRLNRTFPPV